MALKQAIRELALNSIDISVSTTNTTGDQSRAISSLLCTKRSDEFLQLHYDKLKHTLLKLVDHPPDQNKIITKHVQVHVDKATSINSKAVAKDLNKVIEKFSGVDSILFSHVDIIFERQDRRHFVSSVIEKLPPTTHHSKFLKIAVSLFKDNDALRISTQTVLPYMIVEPPPPDLDEKQQFCLRTNAHKVCRYALWGADIPVELGYIGNGKNRAYHYLWKRQMTSPIFIAFVVEESRGFPIGWLSCVHPFDDQLRKTEKFWWAIPFDVKWVEEAEKELDQ